MTGLWFGRLEKLGSVGENNKSWCRLGLVDRPPDRWVVRMLAGCVHVAGRGVTAAGLWSPELRRCSHTHVRSIQFDSIVTTKEYNSDHATRTLWNVHSIQFVVWSQSLWWRRHRQLGLSGKTQADWLTVLLYRSPSTTVRSHRRHQLASSIAFHIIANWLGYETTWVRNDLGTKRLGSNILGTKQLG